MLPYTHNHPHHVCRRSQGVHLRNQDTLRIVPQRTAFQSQECTAETRRSAARQHRVRRAVKRENTRKKLTGLVRFVPSNIPRKRRLQTLAVALWSTTIITGMAAFLLLWYAFLFTAPSGHGSSGGLFIVLSHRFGLFWRRTGYGWPWTGVQSAGDASVHGFAIGRSGSTLQITTLHRTSSLSLFGSYADRVALCADS